MTDWVRPSRLHTLGFAESGDGDGADAGTERSEAFESSIGSFGIAEVEAREIGRAATRRPSEAADFDQPLRLRIIEWRQHYPADDCENGDVDADSQGQREDGDGGEPGALQEHA